MKQEHIVLLKAFDDLKFNLGKKTFIDYIKGDINPTIERNNLDELNSYGCLYMFDKKDLSNLVDILLKNNFLELQTINGGHQVIKRNSYGLKEIFEKKFEPKKIEAKKVVNKKIFESSQITNDDKKLFISFDFFLKGFNDKQKKAILSQEKNILCIAGAGSGKTTVLTKRIEFLKKFKSIKEEKILAITFTKKAKQEMINRLEKLEIRNVQIETFNSFSEKLIKKYSNLIYEKDVRVAAYRDKIPIVKKAVEKVGVPFDTFYDDYFTKKQVREKTADELFFIFVNDIFSIIDYYKNKEETILEFYEKETNSKKRRVAKLICEIAKYSSETLKKKGLRDFTDQIIDCCELFKKNPQIIPHFDHILVDEYQDVNKLQVELLKLLNSQNNFAVGDPRQAIYGWRGSEIKYILDFPKNHENTQVIELNKNYRSNPDIVDFFNQTLKDIGLENLESTKDKTENKNVFLIEQDSELLERRFIYEAIKNSNTQRNEIFVLARTNRILENFAEFFMQNNLKYTIKSEEEYKNGEPKSEEIVLATIHSIKGMQASDVYIVGANSLSFPNKVQDNFVLALIKEDDDYDKEDEEQRLFYVGLSRAKNKLIITYTGNYTKFITDEMLNIVDFKRKNKNLFDFANNSKKLDSTNSSVLKTMLKDWRSSKANEYSIPSYMILSNATIDEITRRQPSNKLELEQVNGLGPVKIAKYGDEILKIING